MDCGEQLTEVDVLLIRVFSETENSPWERQITGAVLAGGVLLYVTLKPNAVYLCMIQ